MGALRLWCFARSERKDLSLLARGKLRVWLICRGRQLGLVISAAHGCVHYIICHDVYTLLPSSRQTFNDAGI